MKKHRSGSAHVAVIVCLVIALMTALGWVFYLNFINKRSDTQSTNQASTKNSTSTMTHNETLLTGKTSDGLGSKLIFDYPKDRTVDNKTKHYYNDYATGESVLGSVRTAI